MLPPDEEAAINGKCGIELLNPVPLSKEAIEEIEGFLISLDISQWDLRRRNHIQHITLLLLNKDYPIRGAHRLTQGLHLLDQRKITRSASWIMRWEEYFTERALRKWLHKKLECFS